MVYHSSWASKVNFHGILYGPPHYVEKIYNKYQKIDKSCGIGETMVKNVY